MLAGVNVVMVVVHGSVGVVPILHTLRPVFRPVLSGVALLLAAEDDEHLVLLGNLDLRVGGLAIDEDIATFEAFLDQFGRFLRERRNQGIEQAHRLFALDAAETLGGSAVIPEPFFLCLLVSLRQAVLQLLIESRPVDDVAELVDEDAFDLHASLIFQHVLFGEDDGGATAFPTEESAAAPVVVVELFAGLVGGELRHVGSQFFVADENAQHLAVASALGDRRVDALHDHVELVCGFPVGVIRYVFGGGDQDVLHHRTLLVEGRIQLVLLGLFVSQRLDFIRSGVGQAKGRRGNRQQDERPNSGFAGRTRAPHGILSKSRVQNSVTGCRRPATPLPTRATPTWPASQTRVNRRLEAGRLQAGV